MVIFQAWNVVCLVQRNDSKKNNSVTKSRIRRPWAVKFIRNWLTHNKPGLRVWACLSNKSGKKDNEKIRRGLVLSTSQPSMKKHLVCLVIYRWWWIRSESRFSSRCCSFMFIFFVVVVHVSDSTVHSSTAMCEKFPFLKLYSHMLRKLWMRSKACCDYERLARP